MSIGDAPRGVDSFLDRDLCYFLDKIANSQFPRVRGGIISKYQSVLKALNSVFLVRLVLECSRRLEKVGASKDIIKDKTQLNDNLK